MGTLYKREGIWYIDVRAKGKRIRKRIGPSKKVAQLALEDAHVKIAKDEFGFTNNDIAIDRLFELYFEFSSANHRPPTTNRYKAVTDHFNRFLSSEAQEIKFISQVTTETIDRYKVYRKSSWVNPNGSPVTSDEAVGEHTRRGARAHTINFEINALKTIFNTAIKWGYIKENPTKGVNKLKVEDAKPVRFLTVDECQRFLDSCSPELYPVYMTFLNTGMRKAELENLQWSDVELGRRKLLIRRKPDWQPKTGEREIPISDALLKLLKSHKKSSKHTEPSDYVFQVKGSGHSHNMLRRELIKIAEKGNIEDLTKIHTLRHTFASHLVMSGVDLPTVKKLMGHSDIDTTMIYAHLAPDHLADAVNRLDWRQ